MRGIIWFREDLRVEDNTALFHAAKSCPDGVIGLYVLDSSMWQRHDVAACRVEFMLRGLQMLAKSLERLHIPLRVITLHDSKLVAEKIFQLAQQYQVKALFYNKQYEINERKRDKEVEIHLKKHDMLCVAYDDQTILPPNSVKNLQGGDYQVFTPYKRAWLHILSSRGGVSILPAPKPQTQLGIPSDMIPAKLTEFRSNIPSDLWPAGEAAAQTQLKRFIENEIFSYHQERDFPAKKGTSQLSPYLAAGMISARTCFQGALESNKGAFTNGLQGPLTWMSELIWREFYKHLLLAAPRVSMHKAYQLQTDKLPWRYDADLLEAWQSGATGYPIVDAAMRQLNSAGWMHNRLRMIVAMFLAKNLFLDWRLGEKYFMQNLIDGDLAANNGGWQWCAGTGVDAAPYFRVFNPVRQSERFDPDTTFIRTYCPELASLSNKVIHDPNKHFPHLPNKYNYPKVIVDLEKSRKEFILEYKKL